MSLKRVLALGIGLAATAGAVSAVRRSFAANPFSALNGLHTDLYATAYTDDLPVEESVRIVPGTAKPGFAPRNLTVADAEAIMAKSGLTLAVTKQGTGLFIVEDIEAKPTVEDVPVKAARKTSTKKAPSKGAKAATAKSDAKAATPKVARSKSTEAKAALKATKDARMGLCSGTTKAGSLCAKKAVVDSRCAQHPVTVNA